MFLTIQQLTIQNNAALASVDGVSSLTSIGGLSLVVRTLLSRVCSRMVWRAIGVHAPGDLTLVLILQGNAALLNVDGFGKLTSQPVRANSFSVSVNQ